MNLGWQIGMFVSFVAFSAIAGIGEMWVLGEMADQINRKKAEGEKVMWPPDLSWRTLKGGATIWSIVKEYRSLYPKGKLPQLLTILIGLAILSGIGFI